MPPEEKPCICLFSASYLPNIGGVETYTDNLARALEALGYRIIVVTSNTHGLAAKEAASNVEVVRLPCRPLLNGRYPIPRKNAEFEELWSWLEAQSIRYVIVNTRFYLHSRLGLSFACKKDIAPVLIEHGSAHLTMGNRLIDKGVELAEHALTAANKRFNASYYAVSAKASAWLEHFGLVSCGELSNSIDADAYTAKASSRAFKRELGIPGSDFVVAFVGRLVPEKGVRSIAQASRILAGKNDISFLIAGDGPEKSRLEALASDRFHVLGRLDPCDVAALLEQADLFCLPSRSEGFATSLLEAAACYTPSVVTDVGGASELIPSDSYGTVIPDAEAETVAEAIRQAADHRAQTAEKGRRVGELVRAEYSWKKTAEKAVAACERAQREG